MLPLDVGGIVTASHRPLVRIEAWQGATLFDDSFERHLVDATWVSDATRWPRHELRMTVGGMELAPQGPGDLLVPGETQFRLFLGVWDGGKAVQERAATVWLDTSEVSRSREGSIALTCYSIEARVSQAGFHSGDLQPLPGESCAALIQRLVTTALGGTPDFTVTAGTDRPVPPDVGLSGDPWSAVEDVARIGHLAVYADSLGSIVIGEKPVGDTPALYTLQPGADGTLVETRSSITRVGAANKARVVFRSTDGSPDVVGSAVQSTGPAAWDGPAGRLLWTDTRDGPVSQAQADQAAADALRLRVGYLRTLDLVCSPDPRCEVWDVADVVFTSGVREKHLLTRVQRDLIPYGPMRLGTVGDFLAGA